MGISASDLLTILSHVKKWVTNLLRARTERKRQSKKALRAVIEAVRETKIYLRGLREGEEKSIKEEKKLSKLWTDLSFELKDLGLTKLADRCNIKGSYWADPTEFDKDFLDSAGNRLEDIEQLAEASLEALENT